MTDAELNHLFIKRWCDLLQEMGGKPDITLKSESWFFRLLGKLFPSTLRFTTTIGKTIYVPDDFWSWSGVEKLVMLAHEVCHLRHQRTFLRFIWHAFLYAFPALPWFPNFRWSLEKEGYGAAIRERVKWQTLSTTKAHELAKVMSGPGYLWMVSYNRAYWWALNTLNEAAKENV